VKRTEEEKREARHARQAARAEAIGNPEAKPRVDKNGAVTCVSLGEKIGKLDCGCKGKQDVFGCLDLGNELGFCTLHGAKANRRRIKRTDGILTSFVGSMPSCGVCKMYEPTEKPLEPEKPDIPRLQRKIKQQTRRIDATKAEAKQLEAKAQKLWLKASDEERTLLLEIQTELERFSS